MLFNLERDLFLFIDKNEKEKKNDMAMVLIITLIEGQKFSSYDSKNKLPIQHNCFKRRSNISTFDHR
jgi:hypothetical protein